MQPKEEKEKNIQLIAMYADINSYQKEHESKKVQASVKVKRDK